MKKINILFYICLFSLTLAGCKNNDNNSNILNPDTNFEKSESEMFTDRDNNSSYNEENSVFIYLNENSINCNSDKVKIEGTTVTIVDEGTFIISGILSEGKIVVNADETDKPQLVFNNVSVSNSSFAPLYIVEADKVVVTLSENTNNELINGGLLNNDGNNTVDGAIYSKQDLTFNGTGNLTVSSPIGHGIVCKDDLVFTGGTYSIIALGHGIDANDSIRINNSNISITAGRDGMHSENNDDTTLGYIYIADGNFDIISGDDGISSNYTIQIDNGLFNIKTNSNYTEENTSVKGIKSTSSMLISGGEFVINSYDDSIHSNLSVVINGGTFELSTNDDGIHADEILQVTNGKINILKSYEGLEALTINILGGDIDIVSSDDGINAAGGNDSSGVNNPGMNGGFGGPGGRPGDNFGGANASSGNGYIEISGGSIYIQASGDGIDANGDLLISGGVTYVCGPTNGDTAVLDYDKTGKITGGEFCGSGAFMMAQTLTGDGQGVISVRTGNVKANTKVTVTDSSGNVIAEYTPKLSYQILIISNDKIEKNNTYTITIGSSSSDIKAQ